MSKEARKAFNWLLRNTDLARVDLEGFSDTELIDHYTILKES